MRNRRWIYNCINLFSILAAFIMLLFFGNNYKKVLIDFFYSHQILKIITIFSILFCLIHVVKLLRFYLIIMENRRNIGKLRFIKLYIKTTFVNILLPFKIGEIFRMYCFSEALCNYKVGILSIIIERFFDTCAILLFMIPIEILTDYRVSYLSCFLVFFILLVFCTYRLFEGVYSYLNHFFLFHMDGKKSLKYLKCLEKANDCYTYVKHLVFGRISVIFGLSICSWGIEAIMFWQISKLLFCKFSLKDFSTYMITSFGFKMNDISIMYIINGSIIFGIVMFFIYIVIKFGANKDDK